MQPNNWKLPWCHYYCASTAACTVLNRWHSGMSAQTGNSRNCAGISANYVWANLSASVCTHNKLRLLEHDGSMRCSGQHYYWFFVCLIHWLCFVDVSWTCARCWHCRQTITPPSAKLAVYIRCCSDFSMECLIWGSHWNERSNLAVWAEGHRYSEWRKGSNTETCDIHTVSFFNSLGTTRTRSTSDWSKQTKTKPSTTQPIKTNRKATDWSDFPNFNHDKRVSGTCEKTESKRVITTHTHTEMCSKHKMGDAVGTNTTMRIKWRNAGNYERNMRQLPNTQMVTHWNTVPELLPQTNSWKAAVINSCMLVAGSHQNVREATVAHG